MDPDLSQGALRLMVAAGGAAAGALFVMFIVVLEALHKHRSQTITRK